MEMFWQTEVTVNFFVASAVKLSKSLVPNDIESSNLFKCIIVG